MTDADLIAALGWQPCRHYDDPHRGCATHLDDGGMWVRGDPWCLRMTNALIGARAGIELAKRGIADAIQHWSVGTPCLHASKIAREWQP